MRHALATGASDRTDLSVARRARDFVSEHRFATDLRSSLRDAGTMVTSPGAGAIDPRPRPFCYLHPLSAIAATRDQYV
jgi:hypothetical protein